jgi:hypothetical protein
MPDDVFNSATAARLPEDAPGTSRYFTQLLKEALEARKARGATPAPRVPPLPPKPAFEPKTPRWERIARMDAHKREVAEHKKKYGTSKVNKE